MTLRPLLRWIAVLTLLVWTGAQGLCQVHCLTSACHDEPGGAACVAENAADSHHGDQHSPGHHDDSSDASCATLKTALSSTTTSPVVAPDFSLLYTTTPATLALDTTAVEPAASFSRQKDRPERLFKPGVCLGPAFRSHAPPVLL